MKISLTYDDIQLVPSFSKIEHRSSINLHSLISRRYGILSPFVASPMDTVCELDMAYMMFLMGGVGCVHRFMTIEEQVNQIKKLKEKIYSDGFRGLYEDWNILDSNWHSEIQNVPIMAAIGVQEEDKERARQLTNNGANILLIDVAHGHHQKVLDMIKWCKMHLNANTDIIAGNIVTKEAAKDLENAGADGLRVGIGGGSLCTTRIKTGFGVPNVTALEDVISVAKTPVIADGGIRTSGDIAKALSLGSSSIMLGSLLAGTKESPGRIIEGERGALYKRYRGSASLETKLSHNKEARNIEGESEVIPFKGGTEFVLIGLIDGIKSALSYNGASNLNEFNPKYVIVTNSGIQESKPHLKLK